MADPKMPASVSIPWSIAVSGPAACRAREKLPDVGEVCGAQERIGNGVQKHICVGVTDEMGVTIDTQPAQMHDPTRFDSM